jgi:hypothetical protein
MVIILPFFCYYETRILAPRKGYKWPFKGEIWGQYIGLKDVDSEIENSYMWRASECLLFTQYCQELWRGWACNTHEESKKYIHSHISFGKLLGAVEVNRKEDDNFKMS